MLTQKSSYNGTLKFDSLTDIKDLSATTPIRKIRINSKPKFLMDKMFSSQKRKKKSTQKKRHSQVSSSYRHTSSLNTNEIDDRLSKISQIRRPRFSSFKKSPGDKPNDNRPSTRISKFQHEIIHEVDTPKSIKEEKLNRISFQNGKNGVIGPSIPLVRVESKNNYKESMPISISDFSRQFNNRTGEISHSKSSFKKSNNRRSSIRIDGVVRVVEESLANEDSPKSSRKARVRQSRTMSVRKKGILKKRTRSHNGKGMVKKTTKVSFSRKKKVFKYNPKHQIEGKKSRKRKRRVQSEAAIGRKSLFSGTINLGNVSIMGD